MWLSVVLPHVRLVCVVLASMFVIAVSHSLCSMYLGEVFCLVCGGCEISEDHETVSQPPLAA
jgi:hypothetical protein